MDYSDKVIYTLVKESAKGRRFDIFLIIYLTIKRPSCFSIRRSTKDIDKLNKGTGKEFDKDYVLMMIKDHKDDINAFKKAESKIADSDYKNFITYTLPILQKHLDAIESDNREINRVTDSLGLLRAPYFYAGDKNI